MCLSFYDSEFQRLSRIHDAARGVASPSLRSMRISTEDVAKSNVFLVLQVDVDSGRSWKMREYQL